MKHIVQSIIFIALICLGVFGLFSLFFAHPMALFIQIVIVGIIVLIGLFFFQRLLEGPDRRRYKHAAKQSRKHHRFAAYRRLRGMRASRLKVISNRKPNPLKVFNHQSSKDQKHLTVIEGKKNKKKKRVLF